jgi:hypothetical protein
MWRVWRVSSHSILAILANLAKSSLPSPNLPVLAKLVSGKLQSKQQEGDFGECEYLQE